MRFLHCLKARTVGRKLIEVQCIAFGDWGVYRVCTMYVNNTVCTMSVDNRVLGSVIFLGPSPPRLDRIDDCHPETCYVDP